MRIIVVLALLLLAGCEVDRATSLRQCIEHCTGADCIKTCGEAVERTFKSECRR